MTKNILFFSEISEIDKDHVGGKGWNLAQLSKIVVNVPAGFVISSDVFSNLIKNLSTDNFQELRGKVSEFNFDELISEIQQAVQQLPSATFAVRSSANIEDSPQFSFAGQFKTVLAVSADNIEQAVKEVWASAFTEQSIDYAEQHHLQLSFLQLAVIVQAQLDSEYSGIAFTSHPITNNDQQMVIEGGWGLGEMLVAGQTTPTTWVIDKQSEKVLEVTEGNQDKQLVIVEEKVTEQEVPVAKRQMHGLSHEMLNELIQQMKTIEHHFGKPQDIEWAVEKEKLYILQARPITTL